MSSRCHNRVVTVSALEPWPETVDWRPVSPRLIWVEELQLLSGTVPVLAGCLAAWLLFDWAVAGWIAAVVVVIAAVRAALLPRVVKAWGYAERERDLLVRHGRLVRRLSIVPYARMQFVDVTAGPIERAFNLATVQLHTAAAASDARVPGLEPAEAARLRDRLTALGEDRAEGL
jgi:membrane protein YdbS with pleckstrin-like domain